MTVPNANGFAPLGAFLVKKESAWGTYAAPDVGVPIVSTSLESTIEKMELTTIQGSAAVQDHVLGQEKVGGNVVVHPFAGEGFGTMLKAACRKYGTPAALGGTFLAAPGSTISAGGNLVSDSKYKFRTALVMSNAAGNLVCLPASAESTEITGTSDNKTATLTWTEPSAPTLPGLTLAGVAVFGSVKPSGGSYGPSYLLTVIATPSTGAAIAAWAPSTTLTAPTTALYLHTFQDDAAQPPSFSAEKLMNTGSSHTFSGLMVNKFSVGLKAGEITSATFDLIGKAQLGPATSSTPTYALSPVMVGHTFSALAKTYGGTSYSAIDYCEAFNFDLAADLSAKWYAGGDAQCSEIVSSVPKVTGSFSRHAVDETWYQNYLNDARFDLFASVHSAGIDPGFARITFGGNVVTIQPMGSVLALHVPKATLVKHPDDLSGQSRLVRQIDWAATRDFSASPGAATYYEILLISAVATY